MSDPAISPIRFAVPGDLSSLVAILNQAILSGNANAFLQPVRIQARRKWMNSHSSDHHPIYVYELDGKVTGYLALGPYRDRPAVARTAEISYYVDYAFHGRGIATALMKHAVADCPRLGIHVLLAVVMEWNEPSIHFLEKSGFSKWGFLPEVSELNGKLCGHLYYGLRLVE